MKKIFWIIGVASLMLTGLASQSAAGVNVHIGLFPPLPPFVVPVPPPVPVIEHVRPVVIEEPASYRVPAGYHHVDRESRYRDGDRRDRNRYWDNRADWRRERAERHWREERHWERERRFEDR
jgi:hypothetical protein